jgi:hypothetical protein
MCLYEKRKFDLHIVEVKPAKVMAFVLPKTNILANFLISFCIIQKHAAIFAAPF